VYGASGQVEQAVVYYQKAVEILRCKEDYGRLELPFNIGNLYADRETVPRQSIITNRESFT
jgi:hypothetical protein